MKIDHHSPQTLSTRVKHPHPGESTCGIHFIRPVIAISVLSLIAAIAAGVMSGNPTGTSVSQPITPVVSTKKPVSQTAEVSKATRQGEQSQPQAVHLLRQVLRMLVYGPAFDAKVRETVWTTGRKVVGVGTYEQSGGGSGRFNLQLTMHDGDGKHRMQQISDGRLAWTRTEISGNVSLRRVDVGRLDEWVSGAAQQTSISPRLKVGAWAEMLSTIEPNYVLGVVGLRLKDEPVWVITGELRQDRRQEILHDSGRADWPALYPTRVRVAVRTEPDPQTGFGELLPVRIEFRSDPVTTSTDAASVARYAGGRLITLIELYSIRPISSPPAERFRFENQEAEVNFTNETDRYIQMYGVRLTERQRWQLRR
jgi:hypothetical protein